MLTKSEARKARKAGTLPVAHNPTPSRRTLKRQAERNRQEARKEHSS